MLSLLAPLLAQLVTLNLGDRTEGRFVSSYDRHYEAETRPAVGLSLALPRMLLSLNYTPLIVAPRLDTDPNYLLAYHSVAVNGSLHLNQTTVTLSGSGAYGKRDLSVDVLGAYIAPITSPSSLPADSTSPTSGAGGGMTGGTGAMPASGTPSMSATPIGVTPALPRPVLLEAFNAAIDITNKPTRATSIHFGAGYTRSGGDDDASRQIYPAIQGPTFNAAGGYRWSRTDQVATSLNAQYVTSSLQTDTWLFVGNERWEHAFDPDTTAHASAGGSLSRTSQPDGLIAYGVYPTFDLGVVHRLRVAGGILSASSSAFSSPVLDPVRVVVDPRIGAVAGVSWTRERFSFVGSGTTGLSLVAADNQGQGAFNSAMYSLTSSYRVARALSIDCGSRGIWQSYGGVSVLPFSWALFLGVNFSAQLPLNGRIWH